MKIATKWISGITVVSLAVLLCMTVGLAVARGSAAHVRWDIVTIASGSPSPGGIAFASAEDGAVIKLTGSGTFVAPAGGHGTSSATTGGGNWETFAPSGASIESGTYEVTGLVRWDEKGTFPDLPDNAVGGLAILRVEFSDGSHGVLTVSCHAASGSDPAIFEGITVSKSFVDYWNRHAPAPGVDANRTIFHIE
jgi:hypothetical protein